MSTQSNVYNSPYKAQFSEADREAFLSSPLLNPQTGGHAIRQNQMPQIAMLQNGGPERRKPMLPKSLTLAKDASRSDFRTWSNNLKNYAINHGTNALELLEWTLNGTELAYVNTIMHGRAEHRHSQIAGETGADEVWNPYPQ